MDQLSPSARAVARTRSSHGRMGSALLQSEEARGWRRYPHRPEREAIAARPRPDTRAGEAHRMERDPHEPESVTVRPNLAPRDAKPEA